MEFDDPYNPAPVPQLEREQRLRLFQQLHQSPDHEDMVSAVIWRRGNWFLLCELCQLPYGAHSLYDEYVYGDPYAERTDHRVCNGDVIHP